MDSFWKKMAVQGVKAQVVLVVGMHLPHFVQDDSKLQSVLQGHCKTVILGYLKVHAVEPKIWGYEDSTQCLC